MKEFKHHLNTIKAAAAKEAKVGYRTIKDFKVVHSNPLATSDLCTIYYVKFSSEGKRFERRLYIWDEREYPDEECWKPGMKLTFREI